jgi:hypothetical protein
LQEVQLVVANIFIKLFITNYSLSVFSKKANLFISAVFLLMSLLFVRCGSNNSDTFVAPHPNVTAVQTPISIQRFEKDLFAANANNYQQVFGDMETKYGVFFTLFVEQIMRLGNTKDPQKTYQKELLTFVQNKDMRSLYDTVQVKYANVAWLEKDLSQAFAYSQHYLPKHQQVPKVISHISAFGPAAITYTDSLIGINFDMYMGESFAPYTVVADQLPYYLRRRCEQNYIVPNTLKAYIQSLYEYNEPSPRLIDAMVHEGKLLYYLDMVLPDAPDSTKIGYTQTQLNWCKQNEPEIWAFLTEKELLFSNQIREYNKLISEAPSVSGMPPETPGRIGIWVGWQIVRRYMQQNPKVSLDELMQIKDGQKILQGSRYKPKK